VLVVRVEREPQSRQLQRCSADEARRVAAAFYAQAALPALPPVVAAVSGADGLSRLRPADLSGERQAPPLLRFVGGGCYPEATI
jgi:hypothetical protein